MSAATASIDRFTPGLRPDRPVWGYQNWRRLLFLHWAVPALALRRLVPSSFELDLHEGVAYVGVVPFVMEGVRPRVAPPATAFNFLETNSRTYVVKDGVPGVYFFSLEAASRLAVEVARLLFALPYHHASMRLEGGPDRTRYQSRRSGSGALFDVDYSVGDALGPSLLGSLEHFLIERYWLFTEREGQPYMGQVHHAPYPVHRAHVRGVRDELVQAAGLPAPQGPPAFAHYSPGVDVEVFALQPA